MLKTRYLTNVTTLKLDTEKCTGCRMCLEVCPHAVFEIQGKRASIADRDACMECGACAVNCPEGAIYVEAGVGCAAALMTGTLRGTEPVCECGGEKSSCC